MITNRHKPTQEELEMAWKICKDIYKHSKPGFSSTLDFVAYRNGEQKYIDKVHLNNLESKEVNNAFGDLFYLMHPDCRPQSKDKKWKKMISKK